MSTTTETSSNTDKYLQLNSLSSNETKQSPLELLALTCSNIGKDCSLPSLVISMKMLNDINRSPVNLSKPDKPFVSRKKSSPVQLHNTQKKSKSTDRRKSSTQSLYTQTHEHPHSSVCNSSECSQCESIRYVLTHSCECQICSAKFYSDEQLIEHMQYNHRRTKIARHHRFRPYFKPFNWMNANYQVPFFYPHLSLTPSMNQIRQYLHVDLDNHQ